MWLPVRFSIHMSFLVLSGTVKTCSRSRLSMLSGATPLPVRSVSPTVRLRSKSVTAVS